MKAMRYRAKLTMASTNAAEREVVEFDFDDPGNNLPCLLSLTISPPQQTFSRYIFILTSPSPLLLPPLLLLDIYTVYRLILTPPSHTSPHTSIPLLTTPTDILLFDAADDASISSKKFLDISEYEWVDDPEHEHENEHEHD